MKGARTLKEYIAGCTFIEGAKEYQVGEKVIGIPEERLKFMSRLSGWDGKKMIYTVGSSPAAPENKSFQVTTPVLDETEEDEEDEVLQKASLKVLRQFAKQEGIKGASKMDKDELIAAIKSKQSEQGE